MDAKELTKAYIKLSNEYQETKATVNYLEQEVKKLRMHVNDLMVDMKMLQNERR